MTTTTREIAYVTTTRVHCDGQGGALGHPRIYLQIGAKG
ncbi:MAG: zinc-finger domain-containing protein, partial [Pseudomonadota bacterium]